MSEPAAPPADVVTGRTVLGPLELLLSLFAAGTLFALMVLRCIDVVGRYAFNAPVPGASELTGLGLALLIFATLPIVTAYGEHVSVGLLESLSMILLTIPIFFSIVKTLGFDPIWFGIIVVVVVEIGMITPPIGLNVFVLKETLKDVPVTQVFRGDREPGDDEGTARQARLHDRRMDRQSHEEGRRRQSRARLLRGAGQGRREVSHSSEARCHKRRAHQLC
ncbi:MAG: TRAP transporter large permease subunit [Pseudolabrys sp.]